MSRAVRLIDQTGPGLEAIEANRKEMGRDLRRRRVEARLTQAELGAKVSVARSTISNAENGLRDFGRGFWAWCDRAFGIGTHFTDWYDHVYAGLQPSVPARPEPVVELPVSAAFTSADPAEALAGYRALGWPVMEQHEGGPALVTGMVVDVLEVSRATGVVAAHSWLESGGREDLVRGLPVLPSPTACLAAIDAGDRWYVLTRTGASPWAAPIPHRDDHAADLQVITRPRPVPEGVVWHAGNGSIPLPPSALASPGAAPVTWAFLPAPTLRLAPPVALLYLLGRAAAMAQDPGALALPNGTVVTPAAEAGAGA
jgi:hypothetical protein